MEPVDMPLGQVLYESGAVPEHVHVPSASPVSPRHLTEAGPSAEIAVVGIALIMGGGSTPRRSGVRSARGPRLPARQFQHEGDLGGVAMHLLLSLDRLNGNDLRMTQELIANMLRGRRAGHDSGQPLAPPQVELRFEKLDEPLRLAQLFLAIAGTRGVPVGLRQAES